MRAIAGLGSRSYAFIVDWHIRILVSLLWSLAAFVALHRGVHIPPGSAWVIWVPAAAIYFLYHPVVEMLLRGQSPGKRIAAVRIVSRDGGVPGHGAVLTRNAFRLVDSLPLFYAVGIVTCAVTEEQVRIGDIVAGTVLVHADAGRADAGRPDASAELPLIEELLERWPSLDPRRRGEIARALLVGLGEAAEPAQVAAADDRELHERLCVALSQRAGNDSTRRDRSAPSRRNFRS